MTKYQSINRTENPLNEIETRCSKDRVISLIKDTVRTHGSSCCYKKDGFMFSWNPEEDTVSLGVRTLTDEGETDYRYVVLRNKLDRTWVIEHIQWIEEIKDNGSLSI